MDGACADARHAHDAVLFARGERLFLVVVFCRWLDVEDIHRADIRADAVSVAKAVVYDDFDHFYTSSAPTTLFFAVFKSF